MQIFPHIVRNKENNPLAESTNRFVDKYTTMLGVHNKSPGAEHVKTGEMLYYHSILWSIMDSCILQVRPSISRVRE